MSDASDSLAKSSQEYVDKSLDLVHEQAARIAALEKRLTDTEDAYVAMKETLALRDTAVAKLEAALHSAFQDFRDDFGDDSPIDDFGQWLALHVTCGKEMRAP